MALSVPLTGYGRFIDHGKACSVCREPLSEFHSYRDRMRCAAGHHELFRPSASGVSASVLLDPVCGTVVCDEKCFRAARDEARRGVDPRYRPSGGKGKSIAFPYELVARWTGRSAPCSCGHDVHIQCCSSLPLLPGEKARCARCATPAWEDWWGREERGVATDLAVCVENQLEAGGGALRVVSLSGGDGVSCTEEVGGEARIRTKLVLGFLWGAPETHLIVACTLILADGAAVVDYIDSVGTFPEEDARGPPRPACVAALIRTLVESGREVWLNAVAPDGGERRCACRSTRRSPRNGETKRGHCRHNREYLFDCVPPCHLVLRQDDLEDMYSNLFARASGRKSPRADIEVTRFPRRGDEERPRVAALRPNVTTFRFRSEAGAAPRRARLLKSVLSPVSSPRNSAADAEGAGDARGATDAEGAGDARGATGAARTEARREEARAAARGYPADRDAFLALQRRVLGSFHSLRAARRSTHDMFRALLLLRAGDLSLHCACGGALAPGRSLCPTCSALRGDPETQDLHEAYLVLRHAVRGGTHERCARIRAALLREEEADGDRAFLVVRELHTRASPKRL